MLDRDAHALWLSLWEVGRKKIFSSRSLTALEFLSGHYFSAEIESLLLPSRSWLYHMWNISSAYLHQTLANSSANSTLHKVLFQRKSHRPVPQVDLSIFLNQDDFQCSKVCYDPSKVMGKQVFIPKWKNYIILNGKVWAEFLDAERYC